jgi:hypothetical protein
VLSRNRPGLRSLYCKRPIQWSLPGIFTAAPDRARL